MFTINVVVIGTAYTGKTSLINSYISGCFAEALPTIPTIAPENYECHLEFDSRSVILNLLDTPGEDAYAEIRKRYYPQTVDVVLLCYSVVDLRSLLYISYELLREIIEHMPDARIILVGTKSDLRNDVNICREFPQKELKLVAEYQAWRMASKIGAYAFYECSALRRDELDKIFSAVIHIALSPLNKLEKVKVPIPVELRLMFYPCETKKFLKESREDCSNSPPADVSRSFSLKVYKDFYPQAVEILNHIGLPVIGLGTIRVKYFLANRVLGAAQNDNRVRAEIDNMDFGEFIANPVIRYAMFCLTLSFYDLSGDKLCEPAHMVAGYINKRGKEIIIYDGAMYVNYTNGIDELKKHFLRGGLGDYKLSIICIPHQDGYNTCAIFQPTVVYMMLLYGQEPILQLLSQLGKELREILIESTVLRVLSYYHKEFVLCSHLEAGEMTSYEEPATQQYKVPDFSGLRNLAYETFRSQIDGMKTNEEKEKFLKEMVQNPVFSQHRNSLFTGGLGRTNTVKRMENYVKQVTSSTLS